MLVVLTLAQVMPAFKRPKRAALAGAEKAMTNVEELMCGKHSRTQARNAEDKALAANGVMRPCVESAQPYQILRAWDHALLLGGIGGLARFKPCNQHCRLLQPTEFRYCETWRSPWSLYIQQKYGSGFASPMVTFP